MDIVSTCRVTKLAMDTKTKVNDESVNPFMYFMCDRSFILRTQEMG